MEWCTQHWISPRSPHRPFQCPTPGSIQKSNNSRKNGQYEGKDQNITDKAFLKEALLKGPLPFYVPFLSCCRCLSLLSSLLLIHRSKLRLRALQAASASDFCKDARPTTDTLETGRDKRPPFRPPFDAFTSNICFVQCPFRGQYSPSVHVRVCVHECQDMSLM